MHNYLTYDEYVVNDDPRNDRGRIRFHLGLVPVPYAGNLSSAKLFLLMANPGFQSLDYFAESFVPKFKKRAIQNLRQEGQEEKYPMLYLDPEFAWHGGGEYWRK